MVSKFVAGKWGVVAAAIVAASLLASCGGGGSPAVTAQVSSTSAHASGCDETSSNCLNLNDLQVTQYKGGLAAAASYTFDDGLNSAFQVADIFDAQHLHASFYINPGQVLAKEWPLWRGVSAHGHEIGNHSMTHLKVADPQVTDATLKYQITDAQSLIEKQIGIRPLIFVFPFDAWDDRSMAVAMSTHIATRLPGFKSDPLYRIVDFVATLSLDQANVLLTQTVESGGWYVAAGHGVDGNGWSPVTSDFLKAHLAFARSIPSLWIDTFYAVTQYRLCRQAARLDVSVVSANDIVVNVGGTFPAYCSAPLTVSIPVLFSPKGDFEVRTGDNVVIQSQRAGSKLLFDVIPGTQVHLTLKAKQ